MKFYKILLGILLSVALLAGCTDKVQQEIQKSAEKLNENAPFMLNETNRFDSVSALPNHTLQYNITITHVTKDEVDIANLDAQLPLLVEQLKSSIPQNLKNHGVTFTYSYSDRNGEFAHKLTVTPDMYQN